MKRTVFAAVLASVAAVAAAHPHFNKTISAKLPSGVDVTITYNTTPSNEMHATNAKVGEFVTPRQPRLKLSAEVKSGAQAIPAGEYTIGVIPRSASAPIVRAPVTISTQPFAASTSAASTSRSE